MRALSQVVPRTALAWAQGARAHSANVRQCLIVADVCWRHPTFILAAGLLHEPLPIHVTNEQSLKLECRSVPTR